MRPVVSPGWNSTQTSGLVRPRTARTPITPGASAIRKTLKTLVHDRIHMGTKNVRLDEDVYERVKAHKRDDETFSEAIDRLIGGWSLLELADTTTEEEAERHREAIEASDQASNARTEELLEKLEGAEEADGDS